MDRGTWLPVRIHETALPMTLPTEGKPGKHRSAKPKPYLRVLKYVVMVGAGVFLLLLGVGLLLTVFFPSDLVRKELEVRLSDMVQGTVRIKFLSFNLVTGLELTGVHVSKNDQTLLALETLILDYRFWDLLQQRLTVNEIRLDGAEISLDLPQLRASRAQIESTPKPEASAAEIPPIPVAIDLQSLVVSGANLSVVVSSGLTVRLHDLNIGIAAGLSGDVAKLDGFVRIAQVEVASAGKNLHLPSNLNFTLSANLATQSLHVDAFTMTSPPALAVTVSGDVINFLGEPAVDVVMKDVRVDLEEVLELVKNFIPPDLRDVNVSGQVSPAFTVRGSLTPSGFQGLLNGDVALKQVALHLPQFDTTLSPTDVAVKVSDLVVKDNFPESTTINLRVTMEQAAFQKYGVGDVALEVSGDYFALGPVSTQMTFSGISVLPAVGGFPALSLPVSLEINAVGNHRLQELTLRQLEVKLGRLLDVEAQGFVRPQADDDSPSEVSLTAKVEPHIDQMLALLPKEWVSGVTVQKFLAPDSILVNGSGTLDAEYHPVQANATVQTHFSDMQFVQEPLALDGMLKDLHVAVALAYQASQRSLSGSMSGTLNLSDVVYGSMVQLGTLRMTVGSSFSGALSSSYELVDLRAKDTLTLDLGKVGYDSPTLRARLDGLTLSAKTHEDLIQRAFSLDDFRLASGSLLQVNAAGQFRQDTQVFRAQIEIPRMNLEGLLQRVSGEGVESLQGIHPRGEVEVSVLASGRIPQKEAIEHLEFPFSIHSRVIARGVSGVFAQHRVDDATAKMVFDFSPGASSLATLTTDLTVGGIQLAPELFLNRLAHSKVNLDLSVRSFDEVDIRTLDLATQGAEVSLKGYVAGIKEFLYPKPHIPAAVGKLFVNLKSQAQVGLEAFPQILRGAGLNGSGQARAELAIFKKEEGPMMVVVKAGGAGLGVSRDGLRVDNLNGQLELRKHLNWADPPSVRQRVFNPTDVLAQLRSIGHQGQRMSIDLLDLGIVTIRNFSTYAGFDRNAFKIQNLAMNVLGGGMGGNLVVSTGHGFGLSGRFEIAHLDLNNLLEERLKIVGDSLVDATIGISVFFDESTGTLDLSRTELNLFITHIGAKALDRVLVFLDPDGSNPTLVNARSQIKLANPSRVTIQLTRGMMSLEILFSEGIVPPFRMNRIPVGKLKNVQGVTAHIPHWEDIRALMVLLGAETYGVDEQGQWVMR